MLHSYWFIQARKTFEAVLQQDPNCAMAYWGIAVDLLGNTLSAPPPPKNLQLAWEALEKAQAIGAKTPRERDWIEALSAYYRDHDKVPVETRLLAYTKAMEQVTQRYPDDFEAWVFYALTLQASAPKADKTYANQLKSAAILERLLQQQPEHPGVAHFLIHAYDFPPLAEKGLPAARRYTGLAPAASHARHMPSHIYSMVGLWEESIASNRFALEIQPDYYHASDFMVYAHLQLGQDAKAKAMIEQAAGTADTGTRVVTFVNFTAHAAMPARYALERADWSGAAALPITATQYPMADSLTRFARGLGMARSGDLAGAKQEIQALQELRTALQQANQSYWADRTEEQRLAVSAWVAHAEEHRSKRYSSCVPLPTAKTAASSTWQWRTDCIRCASCSVSCCSRWDRQRPRYASSKRRLRRPRTAIAASTRSARGGGSRRPPEGARVLREARHTGAEGGYPAAGNRARKGVPRPALSRESPRPRAENERPMVPSKPVEFADQTPP